jgi:hypothetical protein
VKLEIIHHCELELSGGVLECCRQRDSLAISIHPKSGNRLLAELLKLPIFSLYYISLELYSQDHDRIGEVGVSYYKVAGVS